MQEPAVREPAGSVPEAREAAAPEPAGWVPEVQEAVAPERGALGQAAVQGQAVPEW